MGKHGILAICLLLLVVASFLFGPAILKTIPYKWLDAFYTLVLLYSLIVNLIFLIKAIKQYRRSRRKDAQ